MLQAVLDQLPKRVGKCEFSILTTYPRADSAELPPGKGQLVPATPRQILFPLLPLALLAMFLRTLRLPTRWLALTPAMRAIMGADVVLDLAGISFVDGRGIPILVYNFLMTGIPKLAGARVVKCSQAMGPFKDPINRFAARMVLPRLDGICARGRRTVEHLEDLGITEAVEAADLAFLLEVPQAALDRLDEFLPPNLDYLAVAPSSVVDACCRSLGIDYASLIVDVIDNQIMGGRSVVLFPHSFKADDAESRMNDGPLCRRIHAALERPDACLLVDQSEPPAVLRALIGRSTALVTSRFHAMISALATRTPVLVVGWSHKYEEVMEEFGLEMHVLRYESLTSPGLQEAMACLEAERETVVKAISTRLSDVMASAGRNLTVVNDVLRH